MMPGKLEIFLEQEYVQPQAISLLGCGGRTLTLFYSLLVLAFYLVTSYALLTSVHFKCTTDENSPACCIFGVVLSKKHDR